MMIDKNNDIWKKVKLEVDTKLSIWFKMIGFCVNTDK